MTFSSDFSQCLSNYGIAYLAAVTQLLHESSCDRRSGIYWLPLV